MARFENDTSMGGAERRFPPTEWTRLLDPVQKEAILTELCTRYWKPLYCYLRSLGFGNDEAKDFVQSFLSEKVIEQEIISQADRTKGKLRTFLLTALRNYVLNAARRQHSHLSLDETIADGLASESPEFAYDRAWADELLRDVLNQLDAECCKRNKVIHWQLFEEWFLRPQTDGDRPPMKDLCDKYGIEDAGKAYHMIENIKRRFRTILRNELEMLVGSEGEVDAEIYSFINIFQGGTAR